MLARLKIKGAVDDKVRLHCGYVHVPAVDRPQSEPFRALCTVTEVEREGLVYLVAVSRDAEEIGVQERRADAYDPLE